MSAKNTMAVKMVNGAVKRVSKFSGAHEWSGGENLPKKGGFIVAINHTTYLDAVISAHFLHDNGVTPSYMVKHELFNVPIIGSAIKHSGTHIPVHRGTSKAADSLVEAEHVLSEGGVVALYPEGTYTKDPELWPMRARSGAARLALTTGVPVIPVAHWGTNDVMHRDSVKMKVYPRKKILCAAGPAVDLSEFMGRPFTREVLDGASDKIMEAIMAVLAELREEEPPHRLWDPWKDGLAEGNVIMPSFKVQKKRARQIVRQEMAPTPRHLAKNIRPSSIKRSRERYWEILGNKHWKRYEEQQEEMNHD